MLLGPKHKWVNVLLVRNQWDVGGVGDQMNRIPML